MILLYTTKLTCFPQRCGRTKDTAIVVDSDNDKGLLNSGETIPLRVVRSQKYWQ